MPCPSTPTQLPSETAVRADGGSGPYLRRRQSLEDSEARFGEEMAQDMGARLTKIAIPQLSGHEQIQLLDIVECAGFVEKQRRSMDENAARYMVFFRQNTLRKGGAGRVDVSWREISWAFHSTSQDILVDFVTRQHQQGALLWANARESGMFMWLADSTAVKQQFELVARNEYARSEPRDPVACSLFYLALRKKMVLQGLWRMATWSREQASTQKFLANNFADARWKTAALKNAYALMSKRRFGESEFLCQALFLLCVCVCLRPTDWLIFFLGRCPPRRRIRRCLLPPCRPSPGCRQCLPRPNGRHAARHRRGEGLRGRWWPSTAQVAPG
jgi:hypothetical protein